MELNFISYLPVNGRSSLQGAIEGLAPRSPEPCSQAPIKAAARFAAVEHAGVCQPYESVQKRP